LFSALYIRVNENYDTKFYFTIRISIRIFEPRTKYLFLFLYILFSGSAMFIIKRNLITWFFYVRSYCHLIFWSDILNAINPDIRHQKILFFRVLKKCAMKPWGSFTIKLLSSPTISGKIIKLLKLLYTSAIAWKEFKIT
jgi:hypothetical protein